MTIGAFLKKRLPTLIGLALAILFIVLDEQIPPALLNMVCSQ